MMSYDSKKLINLNVTVLCFGATTSLNAVLQTGPSVPCDQHNPVCDQNRSNKI